MSNRGGYSLVPTYDPTEGYIQDNMKIKNIFRTFSEEDLR